MTPTKKYDVYILFSSEFSNYFLTGHGFISFMPYRGRSSGCVVEDRTINRWDGGSIPPAAISKLRRFCLLHIVCDFWKTQKAGGPFYLVSMPGEMKGPTQGVNV